MVLLAIAWLNSAITADVSVWGTVIQGSIPMATS